MERRWGKRGQRAGREGGGGGGVRGELGWGRWRLEKAQLEQSVEENKERMEKLEGYWGEAQSLCQAVDEHLRETQAQYQALERKYSKAKRLIKDYQQKYVAGGWESWA